MVDVYADAVVRMHLLGAHLVDFVNVFELQEGHLPVMLRRDIGTGCAIDALGRLRGPQLLDFLVVLGVLIELFRRFVLRDRRAFHSGSYRFRMRRRVFFDHRCRCLRRCIFHFFIYRM